MDRYNLSVEKHSTLEKARKAAASDPFIIYQYYDLLEQAAQSLQIEDRPECWWNVNETNLYIDAQRTKGEKASRTTTISGREAITVMAGISAAAEICPPLLVFKGKYDS